VTTIRTHILKEKFQFKMEGIKENISIIVAVGKNYEIGLNNELLWHLSDDLKRFKKFTSGHTVIMGRNTFLSLPKGALPNRRNIVISDNTEDDFPACEMADSIEAALKLTENEAECFVMGGGMIYKQMLPLAKRLYLTRVHKDFKADTWFPEIDASEWTEVETEKVPSGEKNEFDSSFHLLERK